MHESVAPTPERTFLACTRLSTALDAWSSAIAGFALLGGARAFMFIALLGWREPVLGGAGLVLLALVGWVRWQCGVAATAALAGALATAPAGRMPGRHGNGSRGAAAVAGGCGEPLSAGARNVACYNRSSQCDACGATHRSRMAATVPGPFGQARTQP